MEDFRYRAACRDVDPELFFPPGTGRAALAQTNRAKAVCRRCDVREPCLEWAVGAGQTEGVWGGLDPDERRALRRRESIETADEWVQLRIMTTDRRRVRR